MILYFSATGNSRYVAALLARELDGQPVMDMSPYMRPGAERLTVTLTGGERLLFVFPVHSWGLPKYLAGVLASMDVRGYVPGQNYVGLLATCGDDAGRLYRMWSETVSRAGLQADAGFTVFMCRGARPQAGCRSGYRPTSSGTNQGRGAWRLYLEGYVTGVENKHYLSAVYPLCHQ